jgi:hypothetical protein
MEMSKQKTKTKLIKHDPATAWALIVGGPHAYVSAEVFTYVGADARAKTRAEMEKSQPYHKAVPAVVLTLIAAANGQPSPSLPSSPPAESSQ